MTLPFAYAFGNARVRAMRSRLLGADDLRILLAAASVPALATAAGLGPVREARELAGEPFAGLLADYRKLMDAYPAGARLLRALLRLHEVENLKLAWRAAARSLPAARWTPLWKPLGRLETLALSRWREAASLREAVALARGTPYERIVEDAFRAHETDAGAAELAFDRWAWTAVADEARGLPGRERGAAALALSRVRERDCDALRRAVAAYGLSADAAAATTVLLREEERPELLRDLAAWSPDSGAPMPALSRPMPRASGWDDLAVALRRRRRDDCIRAFRGYPLRLAPAVAYLLLREEEVRSETALAESRGKPGRPGPALERVLAASAMGG